MRKLFCFLIGISFLVSCGGKQPKVDKVIEDGVEVVLNHFEPYVLKDQPSHLDLKEETKIDFEKDEYGGLGIKEPAFAEDDSQGNIYVVEQFPASKIFIYKFTPKGEFIKQFGQYGQGPGELQSVYSLVAIKNGHILVSDLSGGKLLEFDADANLVKETKVHPYSEEFKKQTEELAARQPTMNLVPRQDTPPFNSFFPDDEGRLYVMTYEQGKSQAEVIHDVFNKDGVLIARVPLGKYGILARSLNHLRATATNGRFYRVCFKENGYPELIVYRMSWD